MPLLGTIGRCMLCSDGACIMLSNGIVSCDKCGVDTRYDKNSPETACVAACRICSRGWYEESKGIWTCWNCSNEACAHIPQCLAEPHHVPL